MQQAPPLPTCGSKQLLAFPCAKKHCKCSQENIPRVPPPAGLWEWKNMTSVGVY